MGPDDIEEAVSEYFLFVARRDLWKRHLLRMLNSPYKGYSSIRSGIMERANCFVC